MKNKKNYLGFTLAELLIVVGILMVLVAISIPTFLGQAEKAKETADLANLRSAYSQASSQYLMNPESGDTRVIENVQLASTGALEHVNGEALPFVLPEGFTFSKGSYNVTFDFSSDKPTVTISSGNA